MNVIENFYRHPYSDDAYQLLLIALAKDTDRRQQAMAPTHAWLRNLDKHGKKG